MEEPLLNTTKYSSDEIKLQVVFPEEVWLLIFDKLKDSSDYYSIDAASPYFHKLLLPIRTRILFPEVIKLCIDSMLLNNETYFSLFRCRSACKLWKNGVDTAFHQILSEISVDWKCWRSIHYGLQTMNYNQLGVLYQPDIYDQSKLSKFLEFFHDSHFLTGSNPFPTRSIGIQIRSDIGIYNNIFEILQIYGHHIWHLCVELYFENPEQQQQVVLIFSKLLRLLTHLQTLRMFNSTNWWSESAEYFKPILAANPLPKLKNLKLFISHYTARPIVSELIQKNPHIKGLRVSKLDFSSPSALLSTPLPNLEEIHIADTHSEKNFSELQTVQVQWQLTRLTICLYCNYSDKTLEAKHVFNWMKAKWSETLKELNLYILLPVTVSDIHPWMLPNLTTLRIQMERYASLDFILLLSKSLVSLSVDHSGGEKYSNKLEKDSFSVFRPHAQLGKIEHLEILSQIKANSLR